MLEDICTLRSISLKVLVYKTCIRAEYSKNIYQPTTMVYTDCVMSVFLL